MANEPLREATDFLFSTMKKKGCAAMMTFADSKETFEVFLGGVGAAVFSRDEQNQPVTIDEVLDAGTVGMEWVFNRFYGNHAEFGEMVVDFKTGGEDGLQSQLIIVADDSEAGLLPATMVNVLYFDIYLPSLELTLFNKDPLVLRSHSDNISPAYFEGLATFREDPESIPERYRALAEPGSPRAFAPVGVHNQSKRLPLYSKERPDLIVAYMESAQVTVGIHHGLQTELVAAETRRGSLSATVAIRNLTLDSHRVLWHTGSLNNLEVVSDAEGSVELGARNVPRSAAEIELVARQRDADRPLGVMDCVFVGATNTADRYEDLVSALLVLNAPDGQALAE